MHFACSLTPLTFFCFLVRCRNQLFVYRFTLRNDAFRSDHTTIFNHTSFPYDGSLAQDRILNLTVFSHLDSLKDKCIFQFTIPADFAVSRNHRICKRRLLADGTVFVDNDILFERGSPKDINFIEMLITMQLKLILAWPTERFCCDKRCFEEICNSVLGSKCPYRAPTDTPTD